MPLRPETIQIQEAIQLFGKEGPSTDSSSKILNLEIGNQANFQIKPDEGCAMIDSNGEVIYLSLPEPLLDFFKSMPSNRKRLEGLAYLKTVDTISVEQKRFLEAILDLF